MTSDRHRFIISIRKSPLLVAAMQHVDTYITYQHRRRVYVNDALGIKWTSLEKCVMITIVDPKKYLMACLKYGDV